jgi:hypothetical protein
MTKHPITPPPELVEQLRSSPDTWLKQITNAYQAGADQELEACCEWTREYFGWNRSIQDADQLRAARRPKPPSLKEQAIEAQQRMWNGGSTHDDWNLIRRALEALDD